MKKILSREEIRSQGEVLLTNIIIDPSDTTLPRPLGVVAKKRNPSPRELMKLERTKRAGGLVDDSVELDRDVDLAA